MVTASTSQPGGLICCTSSILEAARAPEHIRDRVARKGRASYLGERSAGHQDPGATSTYYLLDAVGLLNSGIVVAVILSARIIPQTVWFIANFVEAVPVEIEESAFIDGASRFQIVWNLILPLIRPGIAAVATIGIVTT